MNMAKSKLDKKHNGDKKEFLKNSKSINKSIANAVNQLNKSSDDVPEHIFSALTEYSNAFFICYLDANRHLQTRFEANSDGDAVAIVSHVARYGNYMLEMQNHIFQQNMGGDEMDGEDENLPAQ